MHDLKERLANRVQLTTDGHRAYLTAVEDAFGSEVDFAMLQKIYGTVQETLETRYSPAICRGHRSEVPYSPKKIANESFFAYWQFGI